MFPNLRQQPYRVAIEGFGDFERTTLASCLRLAGRRAPAYAPAEALTGADFVIADADDAAALARVTTERRTRDAVFVGAAPPADAPAWLPRPVDPLQLMRALDTLLGARLGAAPAPSVVAPPPVEPAAPVAAKRRPNRATAHPPRGGDGRAVLVVDDSRVARTFLAQRLAALGYRVSTAAAAAEAIGLCAERPFSIVFVDLKLGDDDPHGGLDVCRSVKHRSAGTGSTPAVVITTASGGASDRVRGSLAGCDAYLTKPLLERDFDAALRDVDPLFAAVPG